ncbi:MAG: TIGR02147 family protein [Chitinispirillaceae bacterium]
MRNGNRTPVNLFSFEDHRAFLKEWLDYARRFGMTRREFLTKTGVTSPAFISDVLSGRKNISPRHLPGFSDALGLSGDEVLYFELLVKKDICRSATKKATLARELAEIRIRNLSALLQNRHLEYFTSWVYPVVREYLVARKAVSSPREICRSLVNLMLSPREVESALRKLVKWGFARFDTEKNVFVPDQEKKIISYGDLPHVLLNDVKRKMTEAAVQTMETIDKENRHATMAIRAVSEEKYKELCRRIDELRAEFLNLDVEPGSEDRVVVLNIHAFPVMKFAATGKEKGEE